MASIVATNTPISGPPTREGGPSITDQGSQKSMNAQRPTPFLLPTKSTSQAFPILSREGDSPKGASSHPPPTRAATNVPETRRASFPVDYQKRDMATPPNPVPKLFQAPWVRKPKSSNAPPTKVATPPQQKVLVVQRNLSPKPLPLPATRSAAQGLPATAGASGEDVNSEAGKVPAQATVNGEGPPAGTLGRRPSDALLQRKVSTTSIASAYCTATGVTAAWRRDKTGRPLCGKCCDQLRRMNPRYVAASPASTVQTRPAVRGIPELTSPPRADSTRRATPPYPPARPREIVVSAIRPSTPQPSTEIKSGAAYPQARREFAPRPTLHSAIKQGNDHDLVTLPPMSDLERIAGSYASYYPRANGADFAARRRSDHNTGSRTLISEEDVRQTRLTLLEGRRWILSMLDETTELLKALDEVPHYRERIREDAGSRGIRVG